MCWQKILGIVMLILTLPTIFAFLEALKEHGFLDKILKFVRQIFIGLIVQTIMVVIIGALGGWILFLFKLIAFC